MAEVLSTISLIAYIAAAAAFAGAVFCWVKFKIPQVFGDLSGRTARKSIERMRTENARTGKKQQKSAAPAKAAPPRKTAQKRAEGTGAEKEHPPSGAFQETGLLAENLGKGFQAEETGLLTEEAQTGSLLEETALLGESETMLAARQGGVKLTLLEELLLIQTDDVIC